MPEIRVIIPSCRKKGPRKSTGAKIDTLFKSGVFELGTCEVGKQDLDETDCRFINYRLFKLPETLRHAFSTK